MLETIQEGEEVGGIMVKKRLVGVMASLLLIFFCFSSFIYAETIVLKSGETVEGKIIEKTDDYVKVEFYGVPLTYYLDTIENIDGKELGLSSTKIATPIQDTKHTQKENYYINEEYGVKIWHPSNWQTFDKNVHPQIFKSLLPPGATASEAGLICALSCGKDWNNLEPLIMLTVQQMPYNLKNLSAEDLAVMVEENLKQSSLPPDSKIEYPTVITIADKKLVKYVVSTTTQGLRVKNINYQFVKGAKLYVVNCIANQNTFDVYREVFESIAGSIKVY